MRYLTTAATAEQPGQTPSLLEQMGKSPILSGQPGSPADAYCDELWAELTESYERRTGKPYPGVKP
jgi:hypothetical protein